MTDTLATASAAGTIEGEDWATAALTAPARVVNQCQIFGKNIAVTETERAENPAGFGDAYAYQLEKGTKETMRNIEKTLMATVTATAGASATARVMKTLEDFITTTAKNSTYYTGQAAVAASTCPAVFNAADVNRVLDAIWTLGGNTDLIVMGGAYKRLFSTFTGANAGNNIRNVLATDKKLVVGIDVYDSDFGLIPIQLNRWSPVATNTATATASATGISDLTGRIWFLQRSVCRIAWLRSLQHRLMGTRGDSTVGQIRAECTLEVGNEKALGVFKGVNNIFA
jgi:hypothetical protein